MKILVVSNCYPPHFVGGYELGCRDVVQRLEARGHEVRVLTSVFRTKDGGSTDEPHVQRVLNLAIPQLGLQGGSNRNLVGDCLSFARAVRSFSPDVVYFWSQTGLCLWLTECSRLLGCRSAFFLSDTSFTGWRTGAFLRRWTLTTNRSPLHRALGRILLAVFGDTWLVKGRPVIQDQACHFPSRFLWEHASKENLKFASEYSIVAHWGIELQRFRAQPDSPVRWPARRLLYTGQLIYEKGVHTAIEALALLLKKPGFETMSLTIVGGSTQPEYEQKLHDLAEHLGAAGKIQFLGKVPRETMPTIYREHDILIFPSIWEEPFAITPLEAMVSGMPVVGTVTGGSGELFEDGTTAMVFEPDNAADCARALMQLCSDSELFDKIRSRSSQLVETHHTLDQMVNRIESALQKIVAR